MLRNLRLVHAIYYCSLRSGGLQMSASPTLASSFMLHYGHGDSAVHSV